MWENYLSFGMELGLDCDTYSLFDDKGNFGIKDVSNKVTNLKHTQNKILILINDPCENPTGFCMSDNDYDALLKACNASIDFIKENMIP